MAQAPQFSPVEDFVGILRKLLTEEFTSVKLKRDSIIRKQLEALLEDNQITTSLALSLYEGLTALLKSLPAPTRKARSFQVALWPTFHTFRVLEAPRIWKVCQAAVIMDIDPILVQEATMQYLVAIMRSSSSDKQDSASSLQVAKELRRGNMTMEEHNAVRYVAGYVVRKLKRKYSKMNSVAICQCLIVMEDGNSLSEDTDTGDESFCEYASTWMKIIDRGGLFHISNDVHKLFIELELAMYLLHRVFISAHSCLGFGACTPQNSKLCHRNSKQNVTKSRTSTKISNDVAICSRVKFLKINMASYHCNFSGFAI